MKKPVTLVTGFFDRQRLIVKRMGRGTHWLAGTLPQLAQLQQQRGQGAAAQGGEYRQQQAAEQEGGHQGRRLLFQPVEGPAEVEGLRRLVQYQTTGAIGVEIHERQSQRIVEPDRQQRQRQVEAECQRQTDCDERVHRDGEPAGEDPGRYRAAQGAGAPLPEGRGKQSLTKQGKPLLLAQGIGIELEAGKPATQHGRAILRFCHWRTVLIRQKVRIRA